MSWPMVELKKLVLKVDKWNPVKDGGDDQITYIDLSSVDKDSKAIKNEDVQKIQACLAPSRARQLVDSADVLVATVRPNLNGVALVSSDYQGATASTGYCVLRPNNKLLDSKYLFYWVQTESFVSDMMGKATGANYPAVSDKIVKESQIPLPPLDEQKRIAAILDKADAIRQKRKQAIALADEFLRSVFLEMFGDPVTNPKGWEVKNLSDFYVDSKNGTKCGPFGSALKKEEFVETGIPVWNMDNISLKGVFFDSPKLWITPEKYEEISSYSVEHGDVIISRAGTVGKMGVVRSVHEKSLISTNLIRVRFSEQLLPEYFVALMTYCRGRVGRLKTGPDGAFTHMNTGILDKLEFPYPPLPLQQKFVQILDDVNAYIEKQEDKKIETLFASLSQKAFSGQL
ncbi:restriction endonuclease subunit S [Vibrio vulnificus]|uniref:restriction endonuclease subunit S n=1 Tax=Vibrio vulnificus TaxID=672 RepID=UPI004059FDE5